EGRAESGEILSGLVVGQYGRVPWVSFGEALVEFFLGEVLCRVEGGLQGFGVGPGGAHQDFFRFCWFHGDSISRGCPSRTTLQPGCERYNRVVTGRVPRSTRRFWISGFSLREGSRLVWWRRPAGGTRSDSGSPGACLPARAGRDA